MCETQQWMRQRLKIVFCFFLLLTSQKVFAGSQLLGLDDETLVYSGPSFRYRPLYVLKPEIGLKVAPQIIHTGEGDFYKVLVILSDGRREIGYVSGSANIRVKNDAMDDEDFSKYSELALSKFAISSAISYFRGDSFMVMLGIQQYHGPGFYTKFYVGEYIDRINNGHHLGYEMGNDALISKKLSGFVSYGGGLFAPNQDDAVFTGSKQSGLNYLLRGAIGLKVNQTGSVSFSIGATQMAIFNPNNSFVTVGGQASLEVGL